MQVPPEISQCVAFLYSKSTDGIPSAIGTCFFLSHDFGGNLGLMSYAVTARHVIKNADRQGNDGHSHFRLNRSGGGVEMIPMPFSNWRFPDDARVDLAIASFGLDSRKYEHLCVPREMILTDDVIDSHIIGPGEELFFPGLFVEHQGETANAPIIRLGSIAAMPGEHVMTRNDVASRVYLAECRSIGGLSGSPVFVDIGSGPRRLRSGMNISGGQHFKLLGSIKGHFDEKGAVGPTEDIAMRHKLVEKINMGIALVVPGADLNSLLDQSEIAAEREAARQHRIKGLGETTNVSVDD